MKFCKVLGTVRAELPELQDMFLRYKQLKKMLKALPKASAETREQQLPAAAAVPLSAEELSFISVLNQDLDKFNRFFIEREEEAVIQLQALQEQLAACIDQEEEAGVRARLADFHGSCILMLHWSLLNYAAVAKILKKHDKRSGVLLRAPYLANVLQQPFNSTKIMSRLVKRAEELLAASAQDVTASSLGGQAGSGAGGTQASGSGPSSPHSQHGPAMAVSDSLLLRFAVLMDCAGLLELPSLRRTQLALDTWDTLSRTAHTPSTILIDTVAMAGASRPPLPPTALPPPASASAPVLLWPRPPAGGETTAAAGAGPSDAIVRQPARDMFKRDSKRSHGSMSGGDDLQRLDEEEEEEDVGIHSGGSGASGTGAGMGGESSAGAGAAGMTGAGAAQGRSTRQRVEAGAGPQLLGSDAAHGQGR